MLETKNNLSSEFLRITEAAAIACAHTIGQGDRHHSDLVATEAMRKTMDGVDMTGRIVIGEGERDEAPMLYIGEEVGRREIGSTPIDIAVDPLEGTNLCANDAPNAIAVLAASERGGLLHAPDIYMDKIVVGPSSKGTLDLDAPVKDNLATIGRCLGLRVKDLRIVVLDRPRHEKLITDIRNTGARIKLITDGDLSAGINAAVHGTGIHALMGIGGAPEGVITAAAMRCINGEILARLKVNKDTDKERMAKMGITTPDRIYRTEDLAPGNNIVFAATGVTSGDLIKGVQFFDGYTRTESLLMSTEPKQLRFVDTIHLGAEKSAPIQLSPRI